MDSKSSPEVTASPAIRQPKGLSTAAPILRNNAPRIVSGLRLVPMDKVVTPIPGTPYKKLSDVAAPAADTQPAKK